MTPLIFQQQQLSRANARNAALQEELASLQAQIAVRPSREQELAELERLRRDHAELLKLRGEIGLLRGQLEEARRAQVAHVASAPEAAPKPNQVTIETKFAAVPPEAFPEIQALGVAVPGENSSVRLTELQRGELQKLMTQRQGIDLVAAPKITTLFGRDAQGFFQDAPPNLVSTIILGNGNTLIRPIVTGVSPFTFQWFQNGTLMPGETREFLLFEGNEYSRRGLYTVRVTNAFGSTESNRGLRPLRPRNDRPVCAACRAAGVEQHAILLNGVAFQNPLRSRVEHQAMQGSTAPQKAVFCHFYRTNSSSCRLPMPATQSHSAVSRFKIVQHSSHR